MFSDTHFLCIYNRVRTHVQYAVRSSLFFSNKQTKTSFLSIQFVFVFVVLISTELWFDSYINTIVLSPWLRSDGCFTLIYFYGLEPKINDLINFSLLHLIRLFVFSPWLICFNVVVVCVCFFFYLNPWSWLTSNVCPEINLSAVGLFHIFNLPLYLTPNETMTNAIDNIYQS